ncbi:hypothetical protein [Aureimonas ureilytica]|uniref:hypothetical protein n=1 Tax=Aureimonas ureilytica TaxID=401562 RepID=UPI000734CDB1|nr:hypothetical protein [Aureimonas ureilytica]
MAIGLGRACWRPRSRSTSSQRRQKGQIAAEVVGITCREIEDIEALQSETPEIADVPLTDRMLGASKLARLVALARRVRRTTVPGRRAILDGLTAAFLGDAQPFSCSGRARHHRTPLRRPAT